MSEAQIDYSRPVGWWCATCKATYGTKDPPGYVADMCTRWGCRVIPRYLPLPIPEPVEVDEVEAGEAEVCTATDIGNNLGGGYCVYCPVDAVIKQQWGGGEILWSDDVSAWRWPAAAPITVDDINVIAAASANGRKKREEAK